MLLKADSVYTLGIDSKPRPVHIALYPDYKTKGDILQYLRQSGLTGWPMQSTSLNHMHCTLLHNASLRVPYDFDKDQTLSNPVDLSNLKWHVKPLSYGFPVVGSPVAILFPGAKRLRSISDLLHAKFKLKPCTDQYIFHITLSKIQTFPPNSKQQAACKIKSIKDYYKLPYYEGRMVFDTLKTSFDNR